MYNIDRMSEVTWPWLGGFLQAEGSITRFGFALGQANRQVLDLIREFLMFETGLEVPKVYTTVCSESGYKPGTVLYRLDVVGAKWSILFQSVIPYLRSDKFSRLARAFKSYDGSSYEVIPVEEHWVTGFWEGDGWVQVQLGGIQVGFSQKDCSLLEEIRDFFGWGRLHQNSRGVWSLTLQRSVHVDSSMSYVKVLCDNVVSVQRARQLDIAVDGYKRFAGVE